MLATVLGNPIRRILVRGTILEALVPSVTTKLLVSFFSGVSFISLLFLTAGIIPGAIGSLTLWGLLGAGVAVNAILYRSSIFRIRTSLKMLKSRLGPKDHWFIVLFVGVFVFQMTPLLGLWVTPGDDGNLYSLITQRFVESNGIPNDWGMYAPPGWYFERTHLLIPGFSANVAGLVFLFGFPVAATVSVLGSLFRALTAPSLYVMTLAITGRRVPALLAMSVYGFVVTEPTVGWFTWGGMAELSAVSLLPIAVAATYILARSPALSIRPIVWTSLIIGGMSVLHPFALFYFLAFLIGITVLALLKKELARIPRAWLPVFVGLGMASAPIIRAFPSEAAIAGEYSVYYPGWTPIFSGTMIAPEAAMSLAWRVTTVYGLAVVIFLLGGLVIARELARSQPRLLATLGSWFFFMFLLHENNPNGLFVVPFPLWYRIDANRTFSVTAVIVSVAVALILEYIFWNIWPRHPSSKTRQALGQISAAHRRWRLAAILIVFAIVAGQMATNATLLFGARSNSPVHPDDVKAFDWIRAQTPTDITFFVNRADAGTWIPNFAGRRVAVPFGVVTNYSLLRDYDAALAAFIEDPAAFESLQFMASVGATYVYAGPARIYDRPGFNVSRIQATGLYEEMYHQEGVWIFRLNEPLLIRWLWSADLANVSEIGGVGVPFSSVAKASHVLDVKISGPGYVSISYDVDAMISVSDRFTYIVIEWRTERSVHMSLDVDETRVLDRLSSDFWKMSGASLLSLGHAKFRSVTISFDGSGFGYLAFLGIGRLV